MTAAVLSDLRFIILGSGTSAGVPVIGCECDTCCSDDPRDRRTRCSAAVCFRDARGQQRMILIDTSPDLRTQALRHRFNRCDAILYTHNHVDHTFGLDEVRRFNAIMQAPIDVYAEEHTMEFLGRVYRHIFDRNHNVNDSFVATLIPHLIDVRYPLDLFGLQVTPVRLLHGRLPVLGFRIEAVDGGGAVAEEQPEPLPLAYCTDVSAIPPASWSKLGELRTLVLDMLRYRKHPTHLAVDEAVAIAQRLEAQQTWFIHMSHEVRHAELSADLPETMELAWDGLVLGVDG